jgi:hypothetical protein
MLYAVRPKHRSDGAVLLRFVDADPPRWWLAGVHMHGCTTADRALAERMAAEHGGEVFVVEREGGGG